MKITHNMSAIMASRQLSKADKKTESSISKLSSGMKIVSAKDDAAGNAISIRMREQIKGLERASQNTLDGTSLLNTVEGALNEITLIINRLRELAVQAANGVLSPEDRDKIQIEADEITNEITRISQTSEYNGIRLLGGDLDRLSYASDFYKLQAVYLNDAVLNGDYEIGISSLGAPATVVGSPIGAYTPQEGTIYINGEAVQIEATDSLSDVITKLREMCNRLDIEMEFTTANELVFYTKHEGSKFNIDLQSENPALLTALGLSAGTSVGQDAIPATIPGSTPPSIITCSTDPDFESLSGYTIDGNTITIQSTNGREITFSLKTSFYVNTSSTPAVIETIWGNPNPTPPPATTVSPNLTGEYALAAIEGLSFTVSHEGPLQIQTGTREHTNISIQIPKVTARTLGLHQYNVGNSDNSQRAIEDCDSALSKVLAIRAKIGAFENRLSYTETNLDAAVEATQKSLSNLVDTDMAKEMTEYSTQSVITQAAISILAQANARPQMLLQLLQ